MSYKTRLTKLEKIGSGNKLWALIGLGKPRDAQHQRLLELHAREGFYTSGGDRGAYLAYLPFACFDTGFLGNMSRSDLTNSIMNKTKNPAES
jgi:hypothetical protein